jgi:hypothetical protein
VNVVEPASGPGSTRITRWVAPGVLVLAGAALSVWVITAFPDGQALRKHPLLAAGAPALAAAFVVLVRIAADRTGRTGDLIVSWLVSYLMAIHGILIATTLHMLGAVELPVMVATAVLFLGLGLAMPRLEPWSAIGIRVAWTRDPDAWRTTHRALGTDFLLIGTLALGLLYGAPTMVGWVLVLGPIAAVGHAMLIRR